MKSTLKRSSFSLSLSLGNLFCHDKIATQDLYVPLAYFPKSAQDKDIILFHSAQNLHDPTLSVSREAPLSREKPSSRKENATIVYLERSNRPLVSLTACKNWFHLT